MGVNTRTLTPVSSPGAAWNTRLRPGPAPLARGKPRGQGGLHRAGLDTSPTDAAPAGTRETGPVALNLEGRPMPTAQALGTPPTASAGSALRRRADTGACAKQA